MRCIVAFVLSLVASGAWAQWGGNAKKILGIPIDPTPPEDGQSLVYSEESRSWVARAVAQFPLVDTRQLFGTHTAIRGEYTKAPRCGQFGNCDVTFLRLYGYFPEPSGLREALFAEVDLITDTASMRYASGLNADRTGQNHSPFFLYQAIRNTETFEYGCVISPLSPQTRCTIRAGHSGLTVRDLDNASAVYLFSNPRNSMVSVLIEGTFGSDDQSATFLEIRPTPPSGPPRVALDVAYKAFTVMTNGIISLKAVDALNMPECNSSTVGSIAHVRVDDENTRLFVCLVLDTSWEWREIALKR